MAYGMVRCVLCYDMKLCYLSVLYCILLFCSSRSSSTSILSLSLLLRCLAVVVDVVGIP